jgi:heat shock protein HslJ
LITAVVTTPGCAMPPARSDSIEPLVGSWRLVAAEPTGGSMPSITVDRDGTVSGNSGINKFHARVDVAALSAGNFRLGPVASTRMAGSPEAMRFETAFLQALSAADGAFTSGSTLVFKHGERSVLEFARAAVH